MTGKAGSISIGLTLAAALCCGSWLACRFSQPMQLTLRFHPFVGEEVLRLGQARYANPGGAGSFHVRDFQFFLSNIRIVAASTEFVEPESYHLVRFDGESGIHDIVIENVPRADWRRIEFGIGVDPVGNASVTEVGDLDVNGRMAWSWDVGYKFVLVEGGLVVGDTQFPLVYHVGFDENYKRVSIDLPERLPAGREVTLEFRADLMRMFDGKQAVDMLALPSVKFERADAKRLADNYAHMISLCRSDCEP